MAASAEVVTILKVDREVETMRRQVALCHLPKKWLIIIGTRHFLLCQELCILFYFCRTLNAFFFFIYIYKYIYISLCISALGRYEGLAISEATFQSRTAAGGADGSRKPRRWF